MTFAEAELAMANANAQAPEDVQRNLLRLADLSVVDIRSEWPVDSGDSQDGWETDGSSIVNEVRYAEFVHDGLADDLVPSVIESHDPAIIADIERIITARLEGI